jgi:manganese/iron transport system permease protein
MNIDVLWSTGLMRRATVEVAIVGALGGVVGTHVLLRRLSFLTMSISHASFPGIVIAYWIGVAPLLGSIGMGWLFVLGLALLGGDDRISGSSVIGIGLAGSLGLGAVLQSVQSQPSKNLAELLTGSVVSVTRSDVAMTAAVTAIVLLVLTGLHKELIFGAFDRTGARAAGYGRWLDIVVQLVVATAVVVTVPALGTILAPALLVIPAMSARLWQDQVIRTMALAAALGIAAGLIGLLWSTEFKVAAGPSIALTASAMFAVSWTLSPSGAGLLTRWARVRVSRSALQP